MNSHLENIVTNTCLCLPWCSWQSLPIQSSWVPHEEDMCTAALFQGPPQRMHHMQSPGNKAWMLYFYDVNKCISVPGTMFHRIDSNFNIFRSTLQVIICYLAHIELFFPVQQKLFSYMYNKLTLKPWNQSPPSVPILLQCITRHSNPPEDIIYWIDLL